MTVTTAVDIVGANGKVALGAAGRRARRIFLTAIGGNARFGDVNVSSTQGAQIIQSVPFTAPDNGADPTDAYDLSLTYVYVPSGTTVSVTFEI